ncbi:hypothetical protein BDV24DRAFT_168430 [Aspergillus arachidicola]|uniref:BZIP domain-containing protein n=1 Tax=Aspergillus arachidicola TaxID=656916 RepID=A0A5N6XXG0_9EURO|nr:hypothetical protein BDV24DRAFT_168430 [Aspergillus arachidicola]
MEGDSVSGLKSSTADDVRNSVNPRRRLQNRIAQRKFREKAKARKQCLLQSSQESTSMLAGNPTIEAQCGTEQNPRGISLRHSSVSETPIWDQCVSAQDLGPDNSSKPDLYPPIDCPNLDGEVGSGSRTIVPQVFETKSQPSQYRWDLGCPRGRSFVGQKETHSSNNADLGKPVPSNIDENELKSEMNAVATIQKQRARLCSEGKQLIELWEELYELAALLEIFPVDSDFARLLSEMKKRFLLLFQMSAALPMSRGHSSADSHATYNI